MGVGVTYQTSHLSHWPIVHHRRTRRRPQELSVSTGEAKASRSYFCVALRLLTGGHSFTVEYTRFEKDFVSLDVICECGEEERTALILAGTKRCPHRQLAHSPLNLRLVRLHRRSNATLPLPEPRPACIQESSLPGAPKLDRVLEPTPLALAAGIQLDLSQLRALLL